MLVFPGGKDRFRISFQTERKSTFTRNRAETVGRVDVLDPMDGRHLEPRLTGVDVELQRTGAYDRTIRNHFGCLQVALQVGSLHELHIAEVGETFAADRIIRSVDAEVD